MIKNIVKDAMFLSQKSELATKDDMQVIIDLEDTLRANQSRCVGMAANMIGYKKRIIIYNAGLMNIVMVNPVITSKSKAYQTEEGCLSHSGKRSVTRYENIEVKYLDKNFKPQKGKYSGWIAQIIQHEIDHLEGILI